MRYSVLILCVLGEFVLNTYAGPTVSPRIKVKEITVRVENSSLVYPDSIVLLSGDFPEEQRRQLFYQLRHDVTDNQLTLGDDSSEAVESVLRAADLALKADNDPGNDVETSMYDKTDAAAMHVFVVESRYLNSHKRKRRSARLVRSAYSKQWQDLCETCPALTPQQPVIINIIKTGSGCGNDCTPPQNKLNSCGHPGCEQPFPHHPFMFHPPPPPPHFHHHPPPPPPPPHFHHYPPPPMFHHQPPSYTTSLPPQPVNITPKPVYQQLPQQPAQMTPPVDKCDPCAAQGARPQAPSYGGSFSQSSASAQSSSFAWNG